MGTFFSLSKSATSLALDVSEIALFLFGVLLVVGLIGEYAKSERWKKHVRVFEMFVIIGVAGELLADGGIFVFSSHLQAIADQEIAELTQESGDAKTSAASAASAASRASSSADGAKRKAGEVANETDALTARMGSASRYLGELEQDILVQGPRFRLLENGEDTFIKALKPFAGQRVTVVTCGTDDTERFELEELLVAKFFPKAGWDKPGWARWAGCPNMVTGGNEIYFVPIAGGADGQWAERVCGRFNVSSDATNALCDVLNKLKISTVAWEEKPLPEAIGIHNARLFFGSGVPDGPAEMAYKDPGRIFLLIGTHPVGFPDKQRHPHKSAQTKTRNRP